jgi:hypothetical protein
MCVRIRKEKSINAFPLFHMRTSVNIRAFHSSSCNKKPISFGKQHMSKAYSIIYWLPGSDYLMFFVSCILEIYATLTEEFQLLGVEFPFISDLWWLKHSTHTEMPFRIGCQAAKVWTSTNMCPGHGMRTRVSFGDPSITTAVKADWAVVVFGVGRGWYRGEKEADASRGAQLSGYSLILRTLKPFSRVLFSRDEREGKKAAGTVIFDSLQQQLSRTSFFVTCNWVFPDVVSIKFGPNYARHAGLVTVFFIACAHYDFMMHPGEMRDPLFMQLEWLELIVQE